MGEVTGKRELGIRGRFNHNLAAQAVISACLMILIDVEGQIATKALALIFIETSEIGIHIWPWSNVLMEAPDLLSRIEAMIVELSKKLSLSDLGDGWTDASRDATRAFFEQMRVDVATGKNVSKVLYYVAVVRGLDHWGIGGGRLFEEAAAIGEMVRDSTCT